MRQLCKTCNFIRWTPTCQENIYSSAGQGSKGTGTHTAVAPLHTFWRVSILSGREQKEGSVVQILHEISPLERQRLAIMKPGDVERCFAGPQIAVQQERQTWLQHYMAGPSPTAQLHRNRLFCLGQTKKMFVNLQHSRLIKVFNQKILSYTLDCLLCVQSITLFIAL